MSGADEGGKAASTGSAGSLPDRLLLGTSSWSSKDWDGVFYPAGMAPSDYLAHYASRFRTVEVDATFYRAPSVSMTERWRRLLPEGFLLAAKVPQAITHEKGLEDCDREIKAFVEVMDLLEDRLGPLLFQFPYYKKGSGTTLETFLPRLERMLPLLPSDHMFAVEIRNKTWLKPPLMDLLRKYGIALALIDHPWMPRAGEYLEDADPVTAPFCYVRWLGDRYKIEEQTKTWEKAIIDRTREMRAWVPVVKKLLGRATRVFGYFNNHYAGHAPASIELFERVFKEKEAD